MEKREGEGLHEQRVFTSLKCVPGKYMKFGSMYFNFKEWIFIY